MKKRAPKPNKTRVLRSIYRLAIGYTVAKGKRQRARALRYREALERLARVAGRAGWTRAAVRAANDGEDLGTSILMRGDTRRRKSAKRSKRSRRDMCSKPKPGQKACCSACAAH